jgi:hypothetical protein
MPRFIKRKQVEIENTQAPKGSYGVEDNRVNMRQGDKLELSLDKISVLLDGRNIIQLDQIWAESDKIPVTASVVPNITKYIFELELPGLSGQTHSYKSDDLKNIIPDTFGDKTSYQYIVKKQNGDIIDMEAVGGYVDPSTGILTFVNGNPVGVSHVYPPTITCYQYIGKTAVDTGLGGVNTNISGGISSSQWQDAVIDFTNTLALSPSVGNRYIYKGATTSGSIVDSNGDLDTGIISFDDIIQWSEGESTSGTNALVGEAWFLYTPTNGTFTSITNDSNTIYHWTSLNSWKSYQNEKTFPVELIMNAQDTFIYSGTSGFAHLISDTQLPDSSTPNTDWSLFVNGVKILDELYDFVTLTATTGATWNSGASLPDNQLEFNGVYTVNKGDLVRIVVGSDIYWRTVTFINGDIIVYSGSNITGIAAANLYTTSIVSGNYPVEDARLLLREGLTYDIESSDDLSLLYFKLPED